MGDQNRRLTCLPDDLSDVCRDIQSCLRVQRAERFIQQEKIRVDCHCADQRRTLPHPSGQFGRFLVLKGIESIISQKLEHIVAIFTGHGMIQFQTKRDILIDGAPFKQMVALQHIADLDGSGAAAGGERTARIEQCAFLGSEQTGDDGQERGFADGLVMETLDGQMIIEISVVSDRYFEGMSFDFDMDKICDRLRFEIYEKRISKAGLAREIGVSRDLIFDYTSRAYAEESMGVSVLKSLAKFFGKESYYFCNDYHRFIDTVEVREWLKDLRKNRGMTQRQFAGWIEIPVDRYKSYEQGRCRLPYSVYLMLQEADRGADKAVSDSEVSADD